MSIHDVSQVIKASLALVGVTGVSVGLLCTGYLVGVDVHRPAVQIIRGDQAALVQGVGMAPNLAVGGVEEGSKAADAPQGNFVASKSGTKYYPKGCSGASRIKVDNRIWFQTAGDAEKAGYSIASICK